MYILWGIQAPLFLSAYVVKIIINLYKNKYRVFFFFFAKIVLQAFDWSRLTQHSTHVNSCKSMQACSIQIPFACCEKPRGFRFPSEFSSYFPSLKFVNFVLNSSQFSSRSRETYVTPACYIFTDLSSRSHTWICAVTSCIEK